MSKFLKHLSIELNPKIIFISVHTEKHFFLDETQREKRMNFVKRLVVNKTDFDKIIFTDENIFELGPNNQWLWYKRGEKSNDVINEVSKFPKKLCVFGGISKKYQSPIILIRGTVDAITYVDECIDWSGLILGMTDAY